MTIKTFEKKLIEQIENLKEDAQAIITAGASDEGLYILTMAIDYLELEFKFSLMEITADADSWIEARTVSKKLDKVVIIDRQVLLNGDYVDNLKTLYKLYRTAEGIK